MSLLNTFTTVVLLATTPSILVYPQDMLPRSTFQIPQITYDATSIENDYMLSYDDMIRLLNEIESGELIKKCSAEQLANLKHFVALLAKEGVLPDNSEESLSLDEDINDLLNGHQNPYQDALSFVGPEEHQYMIVPALLYGHNEVVLCRGWFEKQWHHLQHFVKKHKKAIIIGTAVVVAAAVIVVAAVLSAPVIAGIAAASAAGATGAAVASENPSPCQEQSEISAPNASIYADNPAESIAIAEAPILQASITDQVQSFKEAIVQHEFFQTSNPDIQQQSLSWEENARALGSIFAHDSFNYFQHQLPLQPKLAQEIQGIGTNLTFTSGTHNAALIGHPEIDRKFSTDYTNLFANPSLTIDCNALSYQVRGEKALDSGYYNQAVDNLARAIEINPTNPMPYLEKGIAHFGLGEYEHSLQDYLQFTSQVAQNPTTYPFSISEFSLGLAKGFPQGIYESGHGILLFLTDFISHPIHTGRQVVDAVTMLANLVHTDEWGMIAEALAPEVLELVTKWDTLTSDKRGELAGFALGKHGADILAPGALIKIAHKSVKSAQELVAFCKNLQIAQETLVLETAAGIGNSTMITAIVEGGKQTTRLAKDLGFSAPEMGQLKQAGKLEKVIANSLEDVLKNPTLIESYILFEKAESFLEPYGKMFMPESQIRDLIHQTGVSTFVRPNGIPENFRVRLSDGGAGMLYVHPDHTHTSIRIMPGKPHSPNPKQQKPYVIHTKNGKTLDNHGNIVEKKSEKAHIDIDEFVYRD